MPNMTGELASLSHSVDMVILIIGWCLDLHFKQRNELLIQFVMAS